MIVLHNRSEHRTGNPFVVDYWRARTALILELAAITRVCCHHYYHDTRRQDPEVITIESSPETVRDLTRVGDFLEGLRENGLLDYLDDVEEFMLTRTEQSWLADYGLCEPPENEHTKAEVDGDKK